MKQTPIIKQQHREDLLKTLLRLKIEIQDMQEENDRIKREWIRLGTQIRSLSQNIAKRKNELFDKIQ